MAPEATYQAPAGVTFNFDDHDTAKDNAPASAPSSVKFDFKAGQTIPLTEGQPASGDPYAKYGSPVGQPIQLPQDFSGWTPVGDKVTFDWNTAQALPPDPGLVSRAVDVLKKTFAGPTTAIGTPTPPEFQSEASAMKDLIHGHFGVAFQKIKDAESPHIIQGSPLEKLIQTFKPDFKGSMTEQQVEDYKQKYHALAHPVVDVAQFIDKNQNPTLKAVAEAGQSFTSPENVAIMVGSGGLGLVEGPAALAKTGRLLSLGFSAQALTTAYTNLKGFKEAFDKGDEKEAQYQLTHAILAGTISALAAKHGATGKQVEVAAPRDIEAAKTVGSAVKTAAEKVNETAGNAAEKINQLEVRPAQFRMPVEPPKPVTAHTPVELPLDDATIRKSFNKDLSEEARDTLRQHVGESIPAGSSVENHLMSAIKPVNETIATQGHALNKILQDAGPIGVDESNFTRVFHGTTADVSDVSELDPETSRDGAAGRGIYLTDKPVQASKYAGPGEVGSGGRVLAGLLDNKAQLLDGNQPLPKSVLDTLQHLPGVDVSKNYLQVIDEARKTGAASTVEQAVQKAGFDGVKYQHEYPDGVRSGIMLFKNSMDLLKPTFPTVNQAGSVLGREISAAIQNLKDNLPGGTEESYSKAVDKEVARAKDVMQSTDPVAINQYIRELDKNIKSYTAPEDGIDSPSNAEDAARVVIRRTLRGILDREIPETKPVNEILSKNLQLRNALQKKFGDIARDPVSAESQHLSELNKGKRYMEFEKQRERVMRNLAVLKKLGFTAATLAGLGITKELWHLIP